MKLFLMGVFFGMSLMGLSIIYFIVKVEKQGYFDISEEGDEHDTCEG